MAAGYQQGNQQPRLSKAEWAQAQFKVGFDERVTVREVPLPPPCRTRGRPSVRGGTNPKRAPHYSFQMSQKHDDVIRELCYRYNLTRSAAMGYVLDVFLSVAGG